MKINRYNITPNIILILKEKFKLIFEKNKEKVHKDNT